MNKKLKTLAKRVVYGGIPVPGAVRPVIRGLYAFGVFVVESSAFARKLFWVEPVLRSVCARVGQGLRAERLPYMRGKGRLLLGDNVNLSGRSCFFFMRALPDTPEICIGSQVFVGNDCTFSAAQSISVGDHCLISTGVRIHDNDGHPLDPAKRRTGGEITSEDVRPVVIEENVWVGADCRIMKGVRIGRNSVVGTGSVVTSDVPPDSLVAGNPARVVRSLV